MNTNIINTITKPFRALFSFFCNLIKKQNKKQLELEQTIRNEYIKRQISYCNYLLRKLMELVINNSIQDNTYISRVIRRYSVKNDYDESTNSWKLSIPIKSRMLPDQCKRFKDDMQTIMSNINQDIYYEYLEHLQNDIDAIQYELLYHIETYNSEEHMRKLSISYTNFWNYNNYKFIPISFIDVQSTKNEIIVIYNANFNYYNLYCPKNYIPTLFNSI